MKIWIGHGSEHSARLFIIGTFESVADAKSVHDSLEELTELCRNEYDEPTFTRSSYPPAILDFLGKHNLGLNYSDPEQLLFDFNSRLEDNKVVIYTEELEVQAFLKVLLNGKARIEMYSAHHYSR